MTGPSSPGEHNEPDEVADLLKRCLGRVALDAAYSRSLLARLERELPAPRTVWASIRSDQSRRTRKLVVSVGAAAVLLASMLLFHFQVGGQKMNEADRPQQEFPQVVSKASRPDVIAAAPRSEPPPRVGVLPQGFPPIAAAVTERFGFPSTAFTVGQSTLIVRGRVKSFNGALVTYVVDHTVYGDYEHDEVILDLTSIIDMHRDMAREKLATSKGKQLSEQDVLDEAYRDSGIEVGKKVILYLSEFGKTADGRPKFLRVGTVYDVPPDHPLDEVESAILKVLRDGSFAEPDASSGSFLRSQLKRAPLVVIAILQSVDDRSSTWKVERILRGKNEQLAVVVDHDLFRRRALAIAASELRAEKKSKPDPKLRDERAASVMRQLIRSELSLPKRAILFIEPLKGKPDGIDGRVVYRLYDDEARKEHFQSVLTAIQDPNSVPERY